MTAPVRESLPCDGGPVEIFRVGGDSTGPQVTVIGGIHGDEIEGVLAARRLLGMLSRCMVTGQVTVVPVANPPAFRLGSRCGADSLNLARVFPGKPTGTVTEQLARQLTTHVITGTSLLIDMHSAGRHYRMPGFCGYPVHMGYGRYSCRELAERTGFPMVWGHQQIQPGRTISTAQDMGIPWLYFESGGGGALFKPELDAAAGAALAVLAAIGVVDHAGAPAVAGTDTYHVTEGDGDVDSGLTFTERGLFIAHVRAGEETDVGDALGEVVTPEGDHAEWIRSPCRGRVMMIRHSCFVEPGDLAGMVAPANPEAP
ncbi:MAG TPA: M14 family metallopeptidase [Streptosporangiaceae bacterium]|nr:M14 family metallopeptidase [Streptosporangiaceae bacterium]